MLTESQIELWTKLFRITAEMSAPLSFISKGSPNRLEKMVHIFERLAVDKTQPAAIPANPPFLQTTAGNEPANHEQIPHVGLIPKAKVMSIRAVDLKKEKTADFFNSLTWQRHDPSVASISEIVSFAAAEESHVVQTCRRFFAFEIPWSGRGTESEGPQVLDSLTAAPSRASLQSLGEIATQHALNTAKKARREKDLVTTYTQRKGDSSKGAQLFFQNLPWTTRLQPKKIQNV